MFGNRLGWGISAVIVFIACLIGRLIYQSAQSSPATGWIEKTVRPITLPGNVEAITGPMNRSSDAAAFYRKAIDDYNADSAAYAALESTTTPDPAAVAARPGLRALLEGMHCNRMDLFRSNPQLVVNYEREKDPLVALDHVAHALAQLSLRADPATAGPCYQALVSLGYKLCQERVVYAELAMGEELMGLGCKGLEQLAHIAKDGMRERILDQFDAQRLAANSTEVQPVWAVMANVDMNTIAAYAGDWFALSQDRNIDPLWRVEATLKLGELKFSGDRVGDQKAAIRILQQRASDASELPAVRAAAVMGRDLTIEGYRTLQ
jgi:hypothetical protein